MTSDHPCLTIELSTFAYEFARVHAKGEEHVLLPPWDGPAPRDAHPRERVEIVRADGWAAA